MAKFVNHASVIETVSYFLFFQRRGDSAGTGYSFDCDVGGQITKPYPAYAVVCTDPTFEPPVVQTYTHRYRQPAVIECNCCGHHVSLDHSMTNRCDHCETFYNGSGQQLSHPSNWGEETGERFDDNGNQVL